MEEKTMKVEKKGREGEKTISLKIDGETLQRILNFKHLIEAKTRIPISFAELIRITVKEIGDILSEDNGLYLSDELVRKIVKEIGEGKIK
jgi:hypothetical protein